MESRFVKGDEDFFEQYAWLIMESWDPSLVSRVRMVKWITKLDPEGYTNLRSSLSFQITVDHVVPINQA